MIKKINIFLVLLLLLLSVGVVSATADVDNSIMSSNETISDSVTSDSDEILSSDATDDELLTASSHVVTSSNYNTYFNSKGHLISSAVKEGDTLEFDGSFKDKELTFGMPLNIVGTSTNDMKNCVFTFSKGASGSTVSNLKIANTIEYKYGIFLNNASNCVIRDCLINNTGASSYTVCVANGAMYNNVSNNVLNTYGETYGHGTRSTPAILLSGSHYNYIGDNVISCDDANAIYLSSFEGGPIKGGLSNFNTIYNNMITYNVLPTSWAYGIQVMGGNNTISSNRIYGAYRGISTSAPGNVIVDNWIINLTGADYNNPGVPSGGEIAIVGSYHSTIKNNHIVNAKVISTGSGISVLDNSTVENNFVEVSLQGKGIYPQGSNIIIKNNTITTDSGSGILYNTYAYNLKVLDNKISSKSGVGVLVQKVSNKRMPGNITIVGNTISTGNKYAIDAAEANSSSVNVIGPNKIKKGCEVRTPEGSYDPSKPVYNFNGTVHNINPSNYGDYINDNGGLSSDIKDGDILNFTGKFYDKVIFINSAIKITGVNPTFYNTTFRVGCDGVWIENLVIRNNKASRLNAWGILVYKVAGATVTNCDIEVYDPNAAYAIYVVEASDVDVIGNKLFSSGDYLTYTLLAYAVEDCKFIDNTINTIGTGEIHKFESQHCLDGDTNCLDGDTNCLDGDTNCLDGDTNCLDGDTNCLDGSSIGDGNHMLSEVYRTYGILMAYSSGNNVTRNTVNVTSKLNKKVSTYNSTNSIVGIDSYFNTHDNVFEDNEIYIKANDNYIYGMGVLGYTTGHDAPEGQGATNNQFINNYIVIEGTYCAEGIIIGDETEDTIIKDNIINIKSDNVAYGITLEMSQKSTILNNYLELNSDVIYGIEAYASNDNTISGNDLELNAKQVYGIIFLNSNYNSVIDNRILANGTGEKISFNNFDSLGSGNTGIFLKSVSTNNEIKQNRITSTKGYAVLVDDDAINNVISDNYLYSEKGIGNGAVNNTKNNVVEDNYIYTFTGKFDPSIYTNIKYLGNTKITLKNIDDGALVEFYITNTKNQIIAEIGSVVSSNGLATLNYKVDGPVTPSSYKIKALATKENYQTKEFSATFVVVRGDPVVELNDVSAKRLGQGTFIATVSDSTGQPLSGFNVKFYRGTTYIGGANTGNNGVAKLVAEIPSVSGDLHNISAKVEKSSNFNEAVGKATLTINNKDNLNIALNDVYTNPNIEVTFTATVSDDSGVAVSGSAVKFYIRQNNADTLIGQVATGSNGVAKLKYTVPSTFNGGYFITAKIDENANYNPAVGQAILQIKNNLNIAFNDVVTNPDSDVVFAATVKDNSGKLISSVNVKFYIKNNLIGESSTGVDGVAKLNYNTGSLGIGNYAISAKITDTDLYNSASKQANLIVDGFNPNMEFSDVFAFVLGNGLFEATITDESGNAVSGLPVKFYIVKSGKYVNVGGATTDNNGVAILDADISSMSVGSYVISANFTGNNKFNPVSKQATLNIEKSGVNIILNDAVVYYKSGDMLVTILNDIYGNAVSGVNVKVTVGSLTKTLKTDADGKVSLDVSSLAPGTYTASVKSAATSIYESASATAAVVVKKYDSVVSAEDVSVMYGDVNGKFVASLTNAEGVPLSANIVVTINGVDYALKTNSNGQASISTADLTPGEYTATVVYKGNSKYNPSSATAKVTVKDKLVSVVSADDVTVKAGDAKGKFVATLTNAEGVPLSANVVVTLNGVNYALKSNSKGQVSVSTASLPVGEYTATVVYKGNSKYNPSSATAKVTVKNKFDSVVSADDVTVKAGDANGKFVATLTNAEGVPLSANVVVTLNGVSYSQKSNSKGQVIISTADLPVGEYVATVVYKGNSKYNPSSTTAKVTVNDKFVSVVSADDVTVKAGDPNSKFVATLTNAEGVPLSANMVVTLNGVNYALKSNSKGQVSVSTADLPVGEYVATVVYKGNSKYNPSSTTAKVVVNDKLTSCISGVYNAETKEVVGTLTNSAGTPLSANVVVSINGVDYAMKSDSKGKFKVSTANLAPGKYVAKLIYKGNSKYNPASTTVNVVVS